MKGSERSMRYRKVIKWLAFPGCAVERQEMRYSLLELRKWSWEFREMKIATIYNSRLQKEEITQEGKEEGEQRGEWENTPVLYMQSTHLEFPGWYWRYMHMKKLS